MMVSAGSPHVRQLTTRPVWLTDANSRTAIAARRKLQGAPAALGLSWPAAISFRLSACIVVTVAVTPDTGLSV